MSGLRAKAQQLKHVAWVAGQDLRTRPKRTVAVLRDPYFAYQSEGKNFAYERGMFRRSFLDWNGVGEPSHDPIQRRIFSFWTGPNDLTESRARSLAAMEEALGVPVILVTPHNLSEYVLAGHPLHPAYEGLSLVHRSDYLRAYFMHHHGGGYSDIKVPQGSWVPIFDRMDADEDAWITGYPEHSSIWVGQLPGRLGRELKRWHSTIPGGGAFIVRRHTRLTEEWLAEVERRLDYFGPLVSQNPGGVRGEPAAYPISWNRLLAQVVQPLYLKHHPHVHVDPVLKPVLKDYR